jgi:hypothetical protein
VWYEPGWPCGTTFCTPTIASDTSQMWYGRPAALKRGDIDKGGTTPGVQEIVLQNSTEMVQHPPLPVCSQAQVTPSTLWPPNRHLHEVDFAGFTHSGNDSLSVQVTSVTQDEPTGQKPDAVLRDGKLLLRAKRRGEGDGRVYAISLIARDSQGAECSAVVKVCVPHDQGKPSGEDRSKRRGNGCIDSGQRYDSFVPSRVKSDDDDE